MSVTVENNKFDEEAIEAIGKAIEYACFVMPLTNKKSIAGHIVELAATGERDPLELCLNAIAALS